MPFLVTMTKDAENHFLALPEVIIGVVGEKRGNKLFVEGREYHDHESD